MKQGAEPPGSGDENRFSHILLLQCGARGEVLWMSDRTRAALGNVRSLPEAIVATPLSGLPVAFSGILEASGKVFVSAQLSEAEARERQSALQPVERSLLRHYFRLEEAERRLATRARGRRPSAGLRAVRLIEQERQRLGRELHTGIGQMLAAIRLQLEVAGSQLTDAPAAAQQAMQRISILARDALEQVRALSRRLHPPEWQRLGLEEAIRQLWDLSGIPQKFESTLRVEPLPRQPSLEIKTVAYRITQEALSNIAQHSRATRVEASLEEKGGRLALTVRDNGVGFDADALFSASPNVSAGIGLRSVRELAAGAGAILRIESGPRGTKLELTAPIVPD